MDKKTKEDLKVQLSIFGPIIILFAALTFFQFRTYVSHRRHLEGQLTKQQGLITGMAASRLQTYVEGIAWQLHELAGNTASAASPAAAFERLNQTYDNIQDKVEGIAFYDASGRKAHYVSKGDEMRDLPADGRAEEFFSMPKLTAVPYLSPLVTLPGGREVVYIAYPVMAGGSGSFSGVVLAQVNRTSFSTLCAQLEDMHGQMRVCFFDQQANPLCLSQSCQVDVNPKQKALMTGGAAAQVVEVKKGGPNGSIGGRARVLYNPVQIEGYRWYVSSEMPMSTLDDLVRGDFRFMFGMGGFFIISLMVGGLYFSRVYRAKAKAESESALQASLAAERDKLAAVIDGVPDAIALLDREGSVLVANSKFREVLDIPSSGPAEGMPGGGELNIDGRVYKVITVPVSQSGSGPLREIRILRDVTLEKSLEQKKSDLVSMITHDIKSPLTAIIGISGWLEQESVSSAAGQEVNEGLLAISRAGKRILALMDNFLFLSSIEAVRKPNKEPVNLNHFLSKAMLEFHLDAKQRDIALTHDLPENSIIVQMDETQMMRAVANLIGNALKYTPKGGEVRVSAKHFRDYVTIAVKDTGPGIDKTDMPFIFDRYYRSKHAKGTSRGSGLGLAIVKTVVESHGGTVDVDSEVNRGSTFTLRMPL